MECGNHWKNWTQNLNLMRLKLFDIMTQNIEFLETYLGAPNSINLTGLGAYKGA